MLRKLNIIFTLFLVTLMTPVAKAGLIDINTTYDLNSNGELLINGPVSIGNGDTVTLAVDFINDLSLTIGDGNEYFSAWLLPWNNDSSFVIENIWIDFHGFSGTNGASSSFQMVSQSGGEAHIGPNFDDFLFAGQSITFTGFEVSFDVQSITQSPNQYSSLWLLYDDNNASINKIQQVPEPSAMALFVIALMGMRILRKSK